ncbi:MAG: BON domain-containing protein [Proteobacteria bacterium]|nr:BON domain-containing protein [Pseudomonadota bacterium]
MKSIKLAVCVLSLAFAGSTLAGVVSSSSPSTDSKKPAESTVKKEESAVKKDVKEVKQYLSDSDITAKVKEAFIKEKLFGKEKISAMGVHVKTKKGVVTLSGKVSSQADADNAVKIAKGVEGVHDVKSDLKVKVAKPAKK